MQSDDGGSHSVATILVVLITIILAALVLLLFHIPSFDCNLDPVPAIFTITSIEDTDEITGNLNFDSRVILFHTGSLSYDNRNLKAAFYKNNQPVSCTIETMNGHDFISTPHFGVQWMGGAGCSGTTWIPGEMTAIDFTDGTFSPGENVQVDILDNTTGKIISRHLYHH